jgi:hypothetical protein
MHVCERFSMAAVVATLCAGCGTYREETAEAEGAAIETNGTMFNGTMFNGVMFNGVMFNGTELAPLPLAGIRLGGQALAGVSLAGASLTGTLPGGTAVRGAGLAGAVLTGSLSDGRALTLRIDAVTASPDDPDIQRYAVSYQAPGSSAWTPLCGTDGNGAAVKALPLAGSWDASHGTPTGGAHLDAPGVFTFACEGYALAKCVEFGYAPWRSATECLAPGDCQQRSLAPFHQACTRMLRADYCGDGTPTTRDGTAVDVWDGLGIQHDDAQTWTFEAEWGPGGATCVDETRWSTLPDGVTPAVSYVHDHCPARWKTPGCGGAGSTFFAQNGFSLPPASRALLRSRAQEH